MIYRELAPYLKERYNGRVQRVSIAHFTTCPNRDGTVGTGGCTFCEESGSGFANRFRNLGIRDQMVEGMKNAHKKYGADKFIAYFQSFTNTYGRLEDLRTAYEEALVDGVVALDISTRPDVFPREVADLLKDISVKKKIDIFVEFGLESINENTLVWMNRGHSVAEFIDAVLMAELYGFETIAHVILDLPPDTVNDEIACAKLLSALKINGIKMHSLYIVPDTQMAKFYMDGEIKPYDAVEYINRATSFLSYLDPQIVIHRIISTPPTNAVWSVGLSTVEAKKRIEAGMKKCGKVQGSNFDYLNGGSWRKKFSERRSPYGLRSDGKRIN